MSDSKNALVRRIGNARVSTTDQNPDLQIQTLKDYGVPEALIFVDRACGGTINRPNFIKALKYAQHPGTEFVVWNLDRLGRTLEGILEVLKLLDERGVSFFSLTERVAVTAPMGKAMLPMVGDVAELERNLIVERAKAGNERARARGEKPGRPITMTEERVEVSNMMLQMGERGMIIFDKIKDLTGPSNSRAACYAWQKEWDDERGAGGAQGDGFE